MTMLHLVQVRNKTSRLKWLVSKAHVIVNLSLSAVFGVYVFVLCACVCMCVHELVCVRVCSGVCYFCVCVFLCAWQKHDTIREALETNHLKREILFLTCTMWSIVIFVI